MFYVDDKEEDSINIYVDEKVLVVENKDIAAWRRVSDNDTKALINAVQHHGFFKDRTLVENDTELKQVIPYVVLKCDGKYFVTKRIRGDERLVNQYSIGVGGHVNLDDYVKGAGAIEVIDFQATISKCVKRELAEETTYEGSCHYETLGAFVDDKEDVSKVHICYLTEMNLNEQVEIRETDKLEGYWMDVEELRNVMSKMGNWSVIAIEMLGILKPPMKRKRRTKKVQG